eukprot:749666-Hanusia_phi.AAC.8
MGCGGITIHGMKSSKQVIVVSSKGQMTPLSPSSSEGCIRKFHDSHLYFQTSYSHLFTSQIPECYIQSVSFCCAKVHKRSCQQLQLAHVPRYPQLPRPLRLHPH